MSRREILVFSALFITILKLNCISIPLPSSVEDGSSEDEVFGSGQLERTREGSAQGMYLYSEQLLRVPRR